jgi:hypothetical protein
MIVRITLDSSIGADLGPFNLTANAGSVVPSTATRTQLISGLNVTASNSATTLTVTSTGNCTNALTMNITSIPVYASNITASLVSDVTSVGDLRVTYRRTTINDTVTRIVSDSSESVDGSDTDYIINAQTGSNAITAQVNMYNPGTTTLMTGSGNPLPSVQLIVSVNGTGIHDQTINNTTSNLTTSYTFDHNPGDVIIISGLLSSGD